MHACYEPARWLGWVATDFWYSSMTGPPNPANSPCTPQTSQSKRLYLHINLDGIPVEFHQFASRSGFTLAHELGDQGLGRGKVDCAERHR